MRRQRWLLFAILLAPSLAGAQVSNPWEYYPLGLGDTWEYDLPGTGQTLRVHIAKDTTVHGRDYVIQERQLFSASGQPEHFERWPVRFDSVSTFVMRPSFPGEELVYYVTPCPFGTSSGPIACVSGTGTVSHYLEDYTLSDTTLVGALVKRVETVSVLYHYVKRIGEVACAGKAAPSRVLRYARVDGVEYGSPRFPVATEPEAPAPETAVFRMWPNPTRERVTVTIALARSGEVTVEAFDVLGRRMRAWELGTLAAGQHMRPLDLNGLPPGHYVFRMSEGLSHTPVHVTVLR